MSILATTSQVALWVLVILQGMILLGLTRALHRLQEGGGGGIRPSTPSDSERLVGKRAPEFVAVDVFGQPVASSDLWGKTTAMLFVSPLCSNCAVTLDELEGLKVKANGNVVVVCLAGTDECRSLAEDYQLSVPVVADPDERITKQYEVNHTPTAVLVGKGGRVLQYGRPGRADDLEEMMRESQPATADEQEPLLATADEREPQPATADEREPQPATADEAR
jgi:peroxiredoxin